MFGHRTQLNSIPQATLYRVVFGGAYVKWAVVLLFIFMLLQPVALAYASEETEGTAASEEKVVEVAPEPEPEPEIVEESQEEAEKEVVEDTASVVTGSENEKLAEDTGEEMISSEDNETNEEESMIATEEVVETNIEDSTEGEIDSGVLVDDEVVDSSEKASTAEVINGGDTSQQTATNTTAVVSSSSATETIDSQSGGGSGGDGEVEPEIVNDVEDIASSTIATSTDMNRVATTSADTTNQNTDTEAEETVSLVDTNEVEEIVNSLNEANFDDNAVAEVAGTSTTTVPAEQVVDMQDTNPLHFSDNECVAVADGSYYCSKKTVSPKQEVGSAVYAMLDSEGDNEIFYRSATGEIEQITDNQFEDLSPAFDPISKTIVWHRLQNGRYQIMLYTLDDGELSQLTNTNYNNMEPAHEDGVTVWQAWLSDNWEIMMFDGVTTTEITNNETHDIAPDIQGGYVIWQTSDNEKGAAVYEVATGLTSNIDDASQGQIVNPRFVLVYDTKFANGDVITKGFDPQTGEVVPLSAQPGDLPPTIPSPEPTGETQALLQNKSSNSKDDTADDIVPTKSNSNGTSTVATSSQITSDPTSSLSTSTSDVLGEATTTVPVSELAELSIDLSNASATENLPLDEFDLIVEPFSASSSAQVDDSASSTLNVE